MKQKWLLFIVGCIVFGFSLMAHVPARLVVPERLGKLQLLGISGSVWRGEVKQMLYSGKALPVQNLTWKVRPMALLIGTLKVEVRELETPANRGYLEVKLLSRQLGLQALHWEFTGRSLDPWFRVGVSLQGQFLLDVQTLQIAADGFFPGRLKGQLDWQHAALQLDSAHWPIGSPVMQFSGVGNTINGVLTNSQPLVPGNASFQCTTTICLVEMSLQPTPEAPQSLLRGLLLMGLQQNGDTFSGQMSFPLD